METLRDFVAEVLESQGAAIETLEPDGMEVLAPTALRNAMGWPELARLGFGAELPDHGPGRTDFQCGRPRRPSTLPDARCPTAGGTDPCSSISARSVCIMRSGGPARTRWFHGNLACGMWFDFIGPLVAQNFRVIAVDWRGCGASDKPAPLSDYSNYTIRQHAQDMLAAIRCLGIKRCHLATHSTGGLISTYMVLMEPERFGKVLALNPVGPMGLRLPPESFALFEAMKTSREKTRATLALTASTLFHPETLTAGLQPVFADHATSAQKQLFERLVDWTLQVSDGIWFGTATDLDRQWRTGGLRHQQGSIEHRHLVLWGSLDPFIPKQDMDEMSARMPDCRLTVVPGVGHSMIIERPEIYARYFAEFLRSGIG